MPLLRLLLFLLIVGFIWFIWSIVRDLLRAFGKGTDVRQSSGSGGKAGNRGRSRRTVRPEECPSCHQRVWLREDTLICPQCGTPLARSADGKLLIRIN